MTLMRRLVVCLDVKDGRVVKGSHFMNLRDVGDPVELAPRYEAEGADEIVFLDISATVDERNVLLDIAQKTAERLFIPLTIGGGLRNLKDIATALRSGADKVAINSAAVLRPTLLSEAADMFGTQCVGCSIDVRRMGSEWRVFTRGGTVATQLSAVEWASECVRRGAGEIILTSVDRDGTRDGYDIELTRTISDAVSVPVVASGGAGNSDHVIAAIDLGRADAALVAGILHDGTSTIAAIKSQMHAAGLPVRNAA